MVSPVDPLVVSKVIGDVVDNFIRRVHMIVHFGSIWVINGIHIKPSMCQQPPTIAMSGARPDELYTLVMTDPDAPSPSEPSEREWIHWIVCDIPGGSHPSIGNEVVAYEGPDPTRGIHRYVVVLFKQKEALDVVEQPRHRARFSTRNFAQRHDLGLPVAAVYFESRKEAAKRKRKQSDQ